MERLSVRQSRRQQPLFVPYRPPASERSSSSSFATARAPVPGIDRYLPLAPQSAASGQHQYCDPRKIDTD